MSTDELEHLSDVGAVAAADLDALRTADYTTLWQLAGLSGEQLREVPGIDADGARRIRRSIGILMDIGLTGVTSAPQ